VNKLSINKGYPKVLYKHIKEVFQNRAKGTFF
jgi:hypothetical protein